MKVPLNCSAIRAQLGEHLQGQLPPAEALALEQHLCHCPSCCQARALEQRLQVDAGLRIKAPAGFAAAVAMQSGTRPARSGQLRAVLETTAAETAFRAFVDPLLRLDLHLRDACAPLTAPLSTLQRQLRGEGQKLCRYLAFPFRYAGSQLGAALAGPTDAH